MALIKCPECGKENVSDSAETCPECGYSIKAHFDKIKYDEEQKRLAKQREQQKIESEKKNKELQAKKKKQHQEYMNKYFGTPIKKVGWCVFACVIVAVIIIIGIYIQKENKVSSAIKSSEKYVNEIKTNTSKIDNILANADYVYGSIKSDDAIESITGYLREISISMAFLDDCSKNGNRVTNAIDSYINSKTSFSSWEMYKQNLNKTYFVADNNDKSADKLVKNVAYSSNKEMGSAKKKNSVIVENQNITTSGSNYKVCGTVTNNTSKIVYFVKVKVSLKDDNGKVIDTETTYACGDEGLKPNESTKFECYIKKDSKMKSYSAEIYEYR